MRNVQSFMTSNMGRSKRRLPHDFEALSTEHRTGERQIRRRKHKKMDFGRFCAHFGKEEHGSYDREQLKEKWRTDTGNKEAVDSLGVIKG